MVTGEVTVRLLEEARRAAAACPQLALHLAPSPEPRVAARIPGVLSQQIHRLAGVLPRRFPATGATLSP
jgi:hypothetical protein